MVSLPGTECLLENSLLVIYYFSHFSGVIGTGVCVFSRYPIIDAFLHQFPVNGNFYALMHGDWFGGKGIGFCLIQHPKQLIHFFAVHVGITFEILLFLLIIFRSCLFSMFVLQSVPKSFPRLDCYNSKNIGPKTSD